MTIVVGRRGLDELASALVEILESEGCGVGAGECEITPQPNLFAEPSIPRQRSLPAMASRSAEKTGFIVDLTKLGQGRDLLPALCLVHHPDMKLIVQV